MKGRSPTIVDVARAAGVSTATVSRALNGGAISYRAQGRVTAAIEDLGYRPNTLARSLATGRTGVLGVVVPDVAGPLYAQMARGIEDVLEPLGMHFFMLTANRTPELERGAIEVLLERQVDGLIVIGSTLEASALSSLLGGDRAVVLVEREGEATDLPTIRLANEEGARAATEHLIAMGHRQIAHVAGVRRAGRRRLEGYLAAMEGAGLAPGPIIGGGFIESHGFGVAPELLAHEGVTAVFCCNDRVALGLTAALVARGRRIPDDLSVVGFDDLPFCAYVTPALTTVRQDARAMGRLAAEGLVAALAGATVPPSLTVPTELVARASAAPPAAALHTAAQPWEAGETSRPPARRNA